MENQNSKNGRRAGMAVGGIFSMAVGYLIWRCGVDLIKTIA